MRQSCAVEVFDVWHAKHVAQTCNCMHFSSRTKPTMLEPERMGKIQCRGLIYDTLNIINPKLHYIRTRRHEVAPGYVHQNERFCGPKFHIRMVATTCLWQL